MSEEKYVCGKPMNVCNADGISSVMNYRLRTEKQENYKDILGTSYYKKEDVNNNCIRNKKLLEAIQKIRDDIHKSHGDNCYREDMNYVGADALDALEEELGLK